MGEAVLGSVASSAVHVGALIAYINPGVGALLLQAVLFGAAGVFMFLKNTRGRLKGFMRHQQPEQGADQTVREGGAPAGEGPTLPASK